MIGTGSAPSTLTQREILEHRLARLTWAAVSLSEGGHIEINQVPIGAAKRASVTVRTAEHQFTAECNSAVDNVNVFETLVVAMDRAVSWLRQKAWGS